MNSKKIVKVQKIHAAIVQLHTAIKLFFEQNYISSITLAGAAEEILGKLANENITAHSLLIDSLSKFGNEQPKWLNAHIVNYDRNELKHHDPRKESSCDIDLEFSAIVLIVRAIYNFQLCEPNITDEMTRFIEWLLAHKPGLYEGKY